MPGHKIIFISSWLIALVFSAMPALAADQQNNSSSETPPTENSDDSDTIPLQPETIIVTATKSEKDAQAVSMSLSAFPEQQLRDARVFDMSDVALITPNFHFYSPGSRRDALFFIRGVGSSSPNQPAVGVFVDDVYQQMTGFSDFDLSDVERIEVLRGPQSTLYGRNTASGAINVITKKPTSHWEARFGYGPSSFDSHRAQLYAGGPLIVDKLSMSLAGSFFNRDGYSENDFLQTDTDQVKQYSGRITLRYNPTDKLVFVLSTRGGWDRDGGYPLANLDEHRRHPYHVNYNSKARHQRNLLSYTLKTTYSADSYTLQSISNYTDWSNAEDYDRDFMPLDLFNVEERNTLDSVSQEFRLSAPRESQPFQWLAGAYGFVGLGNDYQRNHFGQDAGLIGAPPGLVEHSPLDKNTYGAAIFGQATYWAFEHLEVTAGLRYDYEKQTMAGQIYQVIGNDVLGETVEVDKQKTLNAITPELSFAWNWTPDLKTYARLARGFRSGGFNSPEGSNPAAYDPEFVWNYELGLKSRFLNKKLTINLTLFQMDIHNQQLIQYPPAAAGFFFKNIGSARNWGFEAEIFARPIRGLEIFAGFGLVESSYVTAYDEASGTNYAGNRIPFAPRFTYNLAVQYRLFLGSDLSLFARIDLNGVGSTYWDAANSVSSGSYHLLNARVGIESKHVDIYFFARNLLDKVYESAVFVFPGADPLAVPGTPMLFGAMCTFWL